MIRSGNKVSFGLKHGIKHYIFSGLDLYQQIPIESDIAHPPNSQSSQGRTCRGSLQCEQEKQKDM